MVDATPLAVVRLEKDCKYVRKFVEEKAPGEDSAMNSPEKEGTLYVGHDWERAAGTSGTQRYRLWLEPL